MVLPEGRTTRWTCWWVWGSRLMTVLLTTTRSAAAAADLSGVAPIAVAVPSVAPPQGHGGGTPMPNIGPVELIIILVILLVIFGPKRLPGLGKQLGSGMREFKEGITNKDGDDERERE